MSKTKKFLKELLLAIKEDPSLPTVAKKVEEFLVQSEAQAIKYKNIMKWVALATSIIYSIIQSIW